PAGYEYTLSFQSKIHRRLRQDTAAGFRESRPPDELHLRPVARALECGSRPIDGLLVVILADQHQADRQAVAHPTGQAHRRMSAGIEGSGVRNHFESVLDVEF